MIKKFTFIIVCLLGAIVYSQTTIKATIFDEYLEPFPGAIVSSPNESTTSGFDGTITLTINTLPTTIKIYSVGYTTETVIITDTNQSINVILKETYGLDQVVISASRTPERVMESPVTIERIDNKFIKNTASPNFYEGLKNLKGINILDNNYLTKAVVSNRGFASTDNTRFVQLIDGVDTAVPVFDYSLGNVFGANELDLNNIEILPGAASALYGANAFNGILLMTTKNPFEHQGISLTTKSGVTNQKGIGNNAFYDVGIRMGHKFNDWFAAKVNFNYDKAQDWVANDISNINGTGTSHYDGGPNYDGVNIYGDDFSLNIVDMGILLDELINDPTSELFGAPLDPLALLSGVENSQNIRVSRSGFNESDLLDYSMKNIRFDAALHFRPWGESKTEIIVGTKYSLGNNISQASNRYSQTDSYMEQYRIEFKGQNYFVRAYYNENDAGSSYDSKLAGVYINNAYKDNQTFYEEYAGAYFQALALGQSDDQAHLQARTLVDATQIDSNSDQFKTLLNTAKNTNIDQGGAKLFENSGFYNVDANLNLSNKIDFADVQVGGSFRSFALNSNGQVYTDYDGVLRYRQFGFYTQIQKKLVDDRLKVTGTIRFDKSKNFTGSFSPRATISYAAGDKKDHNFRIGFQTGFRNPTSQDQYSGIRIGNSVLIGSVDDNLERYEIDVDFVSDSDQQTTIYGIEAFENSFTASSVAEFQEDYRIKAVALQDPITAAGSVNTSLLNTANFNKVTPEIVRSFEVGYRGAADFLGSLFEFDVVGFYNFHQDFITSTEVVVPLYGETNDFTTGSSLAILRNDFQRFIISTNAKSTIDAFGFSAGFNTKIFDKFNLGASYAFSDFTLNESEDDIDFSPSFNTPKNSVKLQLNTDKLFRNFGFGIDARWHDSYLYQTRFLDRVVEERVVLDAQINYTVPSLKSVFKVGATNITSKEYISVPEAATIGSQYYVSWTINNL